MARDVFIRQNRCSYCNRTGVVVWDSDLFTCSSELCKTLAFAEVRRRHRSAGHIAPEKQLARALLTSLDTLEYALRRDEKAGLLDANALAKIRSRERQETASLLSNLRDLERRYPEPDTAQPAVPQSRPDPRHRRFIRRGRTVPLQRERQPEPAPAR